MCNTSLHELKVRCVIWYMWIQRYSNDVTELGVNYYEPHRISCWLDRVSTINSFIPMLWDVSYTPNVTWTSYVIMLVNISIDLIWRRVDRSQPKERCLFLWLYLLVQNVDGSMQNIHIRDMSVELYGGLKFGYQVDKHIYSSWQLKKQVERGPRKGHFWAHYRNRPKLNFRFGTCYLLWLRNILTLIVKT